MDSRVKEKGQDVKPKRKIWMQLFGLLALLGFAGVLIPSLTGEQVRPESWAAAPFWGGVFGVSVWRFKEKSGMLGFVIGALIMVVAMLAIMFIGALLYA